MLNTGTSFGLIIILFQVPVELRPCVQGQSYDGPVRIDVKNLRTNNYPGLIVRPFSKMKSADYERYKTWCSDMADARRADNKSKQDKLSKTGHDGSVLDPVQGTLVGVRILKTKPIGDGLVRILFRRKELI